MSAKRLHKVMNRDGFVVETDVDVQTNNNDRVVIAHDPAFIQPPVAPLQTYSIQLNPAQTGSIPILGDGRLITVLSLQFNVPTPEPGFQYQIQTFSTWKVFGNSDNIAPDPFSGSTPDVPVKFVLVDPVAESPPVISVVRLNVLPLSSAQGEANAEDHFLPIEPGNWKAILFGQNLFIAAVPKEAQVFVDQASIVVTLRLIKIPPRIRIALPLDSHRGDTISIVASNVNVDVFGPLTQDTSPPRVASIVAGERIEGIFTGVQDQSLSAQWQIGLLSPSGGATGPTGPDGGTVVGGQGATGPTGSSGAPAGLLFVYSRDGDGTPGSYDVTGNEAVDFHAIGNKFDFIVTGANQFFRFVGERITSWRFEYYVRGNAIVSDLPDYVTPLEFAIFKNGVEVPGSHFASTPIPGAPSSISATGLLTAAPEDVLELRNVTSGGSETVALISSNPGIATSASFTLSAA
jgi:hypothetical protein